MDTLGTDIEGTVLFAVSNFSGHISSSIPETSIGDTPIRKEVFLFNAFRTFGGVILFVEKTVRDGWGVHTGSCTSEEFLSATNILGQVSSRGTFETLIISSIEFNTVSDYLDTSIVGGIQLVSSSTSNAFIHRYFITEWEDSQINGSARRGSIGE